MNRLIHVGTAIYRNLYHEPSIPHSSTDSGTEIIFFTPTMHAKCMPTQVR